MTSHDGDELSTLLDLFRKVPGYKDSGHDDLYFTLLRGEFPECDIDTELRKFLIWILDRQADPKADRSNIIGNIRMRFRGWLVRSVRQGHANWAQGGPTNK